MDKRRAFARALAHTLSESLIKIINNSSKTAYTMYMFWLHGVCVWLSKSHRKIVYVPIGHLNSEREECDFEIDWFLLLNWNTKAKKNRLNENTLWIALIVAFAHSLKRIFLCLHDSAFPTRMTEDRTFNEKWIAIDPKNEMYAICMQSHYW